MTQPVPEMETIYSRKERVDIQKHLLNRENEKEKENNSTNKKHKCNVIGCDASFNRPNRLTAHMHTHMNTVNYSIFSVSFHCNKHGENIIFITSQYYEHVDFIFCSKQ